MEHQKEFEAALNKLGYTIRRSHNSLNDRIYNPNGKPTAWRVWHDRIELETDFNEDKLKFTVSFAIKSMQILDYDTVSLGDGQAGFVNFYNFNAE